MRPERKVSGASAYYAARGVVREAQARVFAGLLAVREELEHAELGAAVSAAAALLEDADDLLAGLEWCRDALGVPAGS